MSSLLLKIKIVQIKIVAGYIRFDAFVCLDILWMMYIFYPKLYNDWT